MSDAGFFDRLDAAQLALATEIFGFGFADAAGVASHRLIVDPRISPIIMVAGLCRAHAFGVGSAIGSAPGTDDMRERLLEASIAVVRSTAR